jgi:hypothetical protein
VWGEKISVMQLARVFHAEPLAFSVHITAKEKG